MRGTWRGGAAPILVIAFVMALPIINASGAFGPLNDLLALGQGGRPDAGPGADPAAGRAAAGCRRRAPSAGRARSPSRASRAACPPARPPSGLHCNVDLRLPPGHVGRLQGLRYVDTHGRECAFYDTALLFPLNALKLDGDVAGRRRARHVRPRARRCRPRRSPSSPMLVAARVAEPQRQARPARGGDRQPVDLPGARLDLRRPRGLPAPGAAVDAPGRPARPRERLLARRQDVLRDRHRAAVDHRGRRDRSQGSRTRSGRATSTRTACR